MCRRSTKVGQQNVQRCHQKVKAQNMDIPGYAAYMKRPIYIFACTPCILILYWPLDFLGLLSEHWLSHPQLCLSMPPYEIFPEVLSEMECRWHCEQQKECVMVAYDPNSHKCWLSSDLKMTPKTGCDRLLDYYIKGTYN